MFVHCSCVIVGIYILLYVFNSIVVVVEKCNKVREREFLKEEEEEEERVEK